MTTRAKNILTLVILLAAVAVTQREKLLPAIIAGPPTAEKLWMVAIDDFPTRTPAQTVLLSDMQYWNSLESRGHDYERYDVESDAAKSFKAFHKFPDEIFFLDADGGLVLGVEEIPPAPNREWADGLVKKYCSRPNGGAP